MTIVYTCMHVHKNFFGLKIIIDHKCTWAWYITSQLSMVNINSNHFHMGPDMLKPHIKYMYEPWYVRATYMSNVSDVKKNICCKSRSGYCIVAMDILVCCKCMFQIFQMFQTYVVSVLSGCCICCTIYTRMLQVYVSTVSTVFKCMLQVFLSGCCICCTGYTRMLQVYVSFVSNVYCKCFISMLHML
jgi:hypothetical protein